MIPWPTCRTYLVDTFFEDRPKVNESAFDGLDPEKIRMEKPRVAEMCDEFGRKYFKVDFRFTILPSP